MADPLDVNIKQGQMPVITVNFPPMPKPEDFGIDWNDAETRTGYAERKFVQQKALYEKALATWKETVATMSQAISTNR